MTEGDLLNTFIEEAKELLDKMVVDLLELEAKPGDMDLINNIFRGMHTLKGSASLTGLNDIANFCSSF